MDVQSVVADKHKLGGLLHGCHPPKFSHALTIESQPSKDVVLLGLFFAGLAQTSNIPLYPLPFINWAMWPTPAMLGILTLFLIHWNWKSQLSYVKDNPIAEWLSSPSSLIVLGYFFFTTVINTVCRQTPIAYPIYGMFVIVEWWFGGWMLSRLPAKYVSIFVQGIFCGCLLNAVVCIAQKSGVLPIDFFVSHLRQCEVGPWSRVEQTFVGSKAAIGFFSYSRIPTGFLLSVALFHLVVIATTSNARFFLYFIILVAGIGSTGSRTGFFCALIGVLSAFIYRRRKVVRLWIAALIIGVSIILFWQYIFYDDAIGRLFGGGNEGLSDAIEGRTDRQTIIFSLDAVSLTFGTGLCNLGSVLDTWMLGDSLKMYRAHGYVFTYLAEAGIIGSLLLYWAVFRLVYAIPVVGCRVLIAMCLATAFADDYFIPNTIACLIPVVCFAFFVNSFWRNRCNSTKEGNHAIAASIV